MRLLHASIPSLAGLAVCAVLGMPATAPAQEGVVIRQKSTYEIARIGSGDLTQTLMIRGTDRQKLVTEGRMRFLVISRDASGTEIVRLDEGQIHRVDDRRQQYQTTSIADIKAEYERMQRQAESAAPEAREEEDVRVWVEREPIQRSGERRTINGFDTEHAVLKLTVMSENTRTGERASLFLMTADLWLDASQRHAVKVSRGFGEAFVAQLGLDPRTAGNPYGRWLGELFTEMNGMEGYPIQSNVALEGAGEPVADGGAGQEQRSGADAVANPVGAALGGMLRRASRPREEPAPNPAASGRPLLFSMSTEVQSISGEAPAAEEFDLPAGYRKR